MKRCMKKRWVKYFVSLCFIVFLSNSLFSCKTKELPPNESPGFPSRVEISFEILAKGTQSDFQTSFQRQIFSQEELFSIYVNFQEGAPVIDFDSYWVGIAALGKRNSGGYGVHVSNVTRSGYETTVELIETKPNGMATMALTYPYVVFKIPKQANALTFEFVDNN